MKKYLRPVVGVLSVAMTVTAPYAQANAKDVRLQPVPPVNTK
jgi:hypothetical protein